MEIIHDFLFLAQAAIFSSKRNCLSYFGRGSPKQHFYEVEIKSAQGYRRVDV